MRILTQAQFFNEVARPTEPAARADIEDAVRRILERVRREGDAAVRDLTRTLDGADLPSARVAAKDLERAWQRLPPTLQRALELSAKNLTRYQKSLLPKRVVTTTSPGISLLTEWIPLARIGAYAPGGRAAYPSTVLMTCVPARVAGVDEVHLATPPGPDGKPSQVVMAAAHLAKADSVWAIGGAQALAAFAYGTATVPRVDKIVGPGNAYVAEAKRQLQGVVGTDAIAGPSELAVWADAGVELLGKGAAKLAPQLRAAGTIFEGMHASASLGDYVTGADHVLPTNRSARWSSPLSVYDFLRQRVRQRVTSQGLRAAGPSAVAIARAEGLANHAAAVERRLKP